MIVEYFSIRQRHWFAAIDATCFHGDALLYFTVFTEHQNLGMHGVHTSRQFSLIRTLIRQPTCDMCNCAHVESGTKKRRWSYFCLETAASGNSTSPLQHRVRQTVVSCWTGPDRTSSLQHGVRQTGVFCWAGPDRTSPLQHRIRLTVVSCWTGPDRTSPLQHRVSQTAVSCWTEPDLTIATRSQTNRCFLLGRTGPDLTIATSSQTDSCFLQDRTGPDLTIATPCQSQSHRTGPDRLAPETGQCPHA